MNTVYSILLAGFTFSEINSCNIDVCLSWSAYKDKLVFKCKVDYLKWKVELKNQFRIELAYCLNPLPDSSCISHYKNCTVTQDTQNNITTLIVKGHIDSKMDGEWTCYHGTNHGYAMVNVTVLKEDKGTLEITCWKEFMAWTGVGFISPLVLYSLLKIIYFIKKRNIVLTPMCWIETSKPFKVCSVTGLSLIIILSILPCVGLLEVNCEEQKAFVAPGLLLGIIVTVGLITNGKDNDEHNASLNYDL